MSAVPLGGRAGGRIAARELSPRGRGAVSVIELTGPGVAAALRELGLACLPPPLEPRVATLALDGEPLDEALVLAEGPERAELHVHGSPPLVARLLARFGAAPLGPPASLEERASDALARAATEAGARILLDQVEGALRRDLAEALEADGERQGARLLELAARGRRARYALAPPRVALAGPVNAGKSTLFNLLYGRERVVASREEGTTRDAIQERVRLGEWAVDLFDTAGERAGPHGDLETREIEVRSIALGRAVRRSADLVLWLDPCGARGRAEPPRDAERLLVVRSRCDLEPPATEGARPPRISALREPERAVRILAREIARALDLPERAWERGAGVPFAPDLLAEVERLAREGAPARRGEGIERLLAARGAGG